MNLYRGMNRAALDAAYNNADAVADSAAFIAKWDRQSSDFRAAMPDRLDLRYGPAQRQRLDFFAAAPRRAPTLLFIHGGYWQARAKELFSFVAVGPLALGINVALVGYTLAPEARLDRIVGECRSALRWLGANLAGLDGDPGQIYVAGWSAGGHLAAMLMDEALVKGAMAISGVYDLEPIRLNYLNDKLRLDEAEARRNSPLLHLPDEAPRLMIAVGGDELPELRRQSEAYHAAWIGKGLPGEVVPLPGRHHFTALEELARPDGVLTEALASLVS
jgi:arylformamidase